METEHEKLLRKQAASIVAKPALIVNVDTSAAVAAFEEAAASAAALVAEADEVAE